MAATCAATAGASTLSNAHADAAPQIAKYTSDPSDSGTGHSLVLSVRPPDPASPDQTSKLQFSEQLPLINPAVGLEGLDPSDTCIVATPGSLAGDCPVTPVAVTLGAGDDSVELDDGIANASIDAAGGTDQLTLAGRTDPLSVSLGATVDPATTPAGLTFAGFENVTGGSNNDTITGDAADNTESGGPGNDKESGGDGIDTLNGGDGEDTLNGDSGADVLNGGAGINALRGGDGNDTLNAGDEGDLLVGGPGDDNINGGLGVDDIVTADGAPDVVSCGGGADTVVADLGANGVFDTINPDCQNALVTGSVAVLPDPAPTPAPTDTTTSTTTITPVIVVPASGTPALVPVLAPGLANFADLTPPSASMRSFSRQRIKTVLTRGVPVRVSCKEACGISVAVSVDRTTAKRLKLDARVTPVIVGTALAQRASAGTSQLRVKLTKRARNAVLKSTHAVPTTTQVLVSDASGNGTLLTRRVTLVR